MSSQIEVRDQRGELRTIVFSAGRVAGASSASRRPRPSTARRDAVRVDYWTGQVWQLGSAAYWEAIALAAEEPQSFRLGSSLAEEVGACLLGGYGMPFELANSAFQRLREEGVFETDARWSADQIEILLLLPLLVEGKPRRYRFPKQRAERLALALASLRPYRNLSDEPKADRALRDLLLAIPGIGPKTASWVVRNRRASNDVAIIDIHLARAGIVAGVFHPSWRIERDYPLFEEAFLAWSRQAKIAPRFLDACIWGILARDSTAARDILGMVRGSDQLQSVWPVRWRV